MLPLSLIAQAPFGDCIRDIAILGSQNQQLVTVIINWSLEVPKHPQVALKKEKEDGLEFITLLLMLERKGLDSEDAKIDPFQPHEHIGWASSVTINRNDFDRLVITLSDGKSSSLTDLIEAYPTRYD